MKIGSLVFATDQGLGVLGKQFYDAGVLTEVAIIHHGTREPHLDWYPGAQYVNNLGLKGVQALKGFCQRMDVMVFFETPFAWELIPYCKSVGVRTVLVPMYECTPEVMPHVPDAIVAPSELDLAHFSDGSLPCSRWLHVPAAPDVRWRLRTKAKTFVHNAGHGGLKGRNGTAELIKAWDYVQSPVDLIIRLQDVGRGDVTTNKAGGRMTVAYGPVDRKALFTDGDVFVFPEKFNGLSLPLQEAHAAGMLVMATDRSPNNKWLPTDPLIPVAEYRKNRVGVRFREFDEAVVTPNAIAATIDKWYGANVERQSHTGLAWSIRNSWHQLKGKWLEAITGKPCVSCT